MTQPSNDFDDLGLKVQRAQYALEQAYGIGTINGIRVVVDAEGKLMSVTLPEEDTVLAAYNAAMADLRPKIEDATRELRADLRVDAMAVFAEANSARLEAERVERERRYEEEDDAYYERRNRRGWFEGA